MRTYEKGIVIYIILLNMLSSAFLESSSVVTTKAILSAITCLVQRLKDINGISDWMQLTSITRISIINHTFRFIAFDQMKFLFFSVIKAIQNKTIKKMRSNPLPSSLVATATLNHIPNGLPQINNIQIVGIHNTADTSGDCLCSSFSRNTTKMVQRISASCGGMIS